MVKRTHRDLLQEVLHAAHFAFNEFVEEAHEFLFRAELREIGQTLHHFGDKREIPCGFLVWELLGQIEERRRKDRWAEETEKDAATDEVIRDFGTFPFVTRFTETFKHFLQLPVDKESRIFFKDKIHEEDFSLLQGSSKSTLLIYCYCYCMVVSCYHELLI